MAKPVITREFPSECRTSVQITSTNKLVHWLLPSWKVAFAVVASVALVGVLGESHARDVNLPCDTAKLIVPWKAGGHTDVIFRIIADAANRAGAKPRLQVVNMAGEGGNKGK